MSLARQQLLHRMNSTNVCLIDVRPAEDRAVGHIPGACSLSLDELNWHSDELPERRTPSPAAAASTACSLTRPSVCSPSTVCITEFRADDWRIRRWADRHQGELRLAGARTRASAVLVLRLGPSS
ncbi:rhodanese-like domain-containing protein [Streptomyces sp. NPDC059454]|uniref:rhodanese-like domain-containing protein n=1 Tax=Streptomyces sp. NPDC059454 TaxID=3346836 RepID=UPI0036878E9D